MIFKVFEKCFKRAAGHCCNKKKIFFTIPFLFICGVVIVFCRAAAYFANNWIKLCLIFLPIFFSFGILYILGLFLVKIYYHEAKHQKFSYFEVIKKTFSISVEALKIPIFSGLFFFILWMVFGFFIAIKEIPHFGEFIGVMISIVPFLIVLIIVLLCLVNFFALFFLVPVMVLKGYKKMELLRECLKNLKKDVVVNATFFFFCIMLIFFISLILVITTILTNSCFSIPADYLHSGIQWFFIMMPIVVFFAPVVIFFFNISCETYNLLQERK